MKFKIGWTGSMDRRKIDVFKENFWCVSNYKKESRWEDNTQWHTIRIS
jgi:hypothetical protein